MVEARSEPSPIPAREMNVPHSRSLLRHACVYALANTGNDTRAI